MAKPCILARPVMRRRTSLKPNQARRQLRKPCQHLPALQILGQNRSAGRIKPANGKLFFAISRPIVRMHVSVADFVMVDGSRSGLFYDNTTLAHQMPIAGAVHHITETTLTQNPLT